MSVLVADRVSRTFMAGDARVHAVADVSLTLEQGEFVALVGPSGCGKSTLLHLCGAMDQPTTGSVTLDGKALGSLSDEDLTRVRRDRIGFVFQFFNLLPTLTLFENIQLPLLLAGTGTTAVEAAARALIERVGLSHRLGHYPQQLSGGEAQRGAVARAVIHRPVLLVADEPTGNLDSDNGRHILDLLKELNREMRVTMLLATHAPELAAAASRIVRMRDGRIDPREHA